MEILDQAFDAVRTFRPDEQSPSEIIAGKTAKAASRGEFELFKTTSIFDGTAPIRTWLGDEPERVQRVMPE